jgi:hypothetical protein
MAGGRKGEGNIAIVRGRYRARACIKQRIYSLGAYDTEALAQHAIDSFLAAQAGSRLMVAVSRPSSVEVGLKASLRKARREAAALILELAMVRAGRLP